MNVNYRLKLTPLLALVSLLAITLAGCASRQAYTRGTHAEITKDFDKALAEFKAALDKEPANTEYRLHYEQARYNAAFQHFEAGRRAADKHDYQTAKVEFTRVLEIDPTHALAAAQLEKVNDLLNNTGRSAAAPPPPIQFDQMRQNTRTDASAQSQLDAKVTGPIDIRMTQDSKVAFETLGELAGLNVIFDRDFRGTRIPIELNRVDIYEALDILALQTGSFWKPLNRSTILVSADNQTKHRDYDDLLLKTIYLSNSVTSTEVTEAITALRTLLNMRYLAQSTAMNAIIVRDTADRIAIAEKIIEDIDKAKSEVLIDVMVLEVDRNTLRQLGILPPQGTQVALTGGTTTTTTTPTTTGTTTTTTTPAATTSGNTVALNGLRALTTGSFSINIPPAIAQFLATSGNTKLVQNPSIRTTDGKQATIRIGSQIPIASGSFQPAFVGATGTPVVNFQFVDVGVNVDITSHVMLNRDISMSVAVQVRALAGDRNVGGVTQPVLTNRQVGHDIRLAEGETNILGGIVTDTESTSLNGLPGLKDIPFIGRLFSQEQKSRDQTEIIIMLTPHILRMPNILEANMRGLNTGSETNTRLLRNAFSPAAGTTPATSPAPAAAPAPGAAPGAAVIGPAPAPAVANTQAQPVRLTNSTVSFSPSPVTLPAAGTATVNIVGNGTDFYGIDLTLAFEPGTVNVKEVREGGFLSRDGQIVAFVQRLETDTGTLHISLERPPNSAPVSGTGNLVTLVLEHGSRPGKSAMRISEFKIRDAQQNVSAGKPAEVSITAP